MTPRPRTPEQILRDITRVNDQARAATDKLNKLLDARRDLYLEARALDAPIPFRRIAEAAGCTEGAVMQVYKKATATE